MTTVSRILVGIDFSEYSREAARYALLLARKLEANLDFVHVFDSPAYVGSGFGPYDLAPLKNFLNRQQELEKDYEDQLQNFIGALVDESDQVSYIMVPGKPHREIIRIAEERDADMIVMGTHGRKGVSSLIIGSVAEKVVRKSKCPVLTVKLTTQKFPIST